MSDNKSGIGVCGVIVGIILGAGAVMYTQDYSIEARLAGALSEQPQLTFRGMDIDFDRQYYNRRLINERDRITNPSPKIVTEPRRPRYPTNIKTQKKQDINKDICSDRIRVIKQIRESIRRLTPESSIYNDIYRRLMAVLDNSMANCKQVRLPIITPIVQRVQRSVRKMVPTKKITQLRKQRQVIIVNQSRVRRVSQAVKPSRRAKVNNNCERYDKKTQRYTRCIVNERNGQRYIGRQTRRYEMKVDR